MKVKFNHTFLGYSNVYLSKDGEETHYKIKHSVITAAVKKYTSGIFADMCLSSDSLTSALFTDLTKQNHTNLVFVVEQREGRNWIKEIKYRRKTSKQCKIYLEAVGQNVASNV